jgi:alpha-L-fucosidase
MYDNHKWPNPIVVKFENIEPAFHPAKFETLKAAVKSGSVVFKSRITEMGDCKINKIGFEYRPVKTTLEEGYFNANWILSDSYPVTAKGDFELEVKTSTNSALSSGGYEYRAVLIQDGLKVEGGILKVNDKFVE